MLERSKKVLSHILLYIMITTVLVASLYASAFLPQDKIIENAKTSAELLIEEGAYPTFGDHAPSSTLDNWTDALMLNLSASMNSEDLESVWSNSYYGKESSKITADDLYAYANGDEDMNKGSYPRYWMGFRASLRLALTFLNFAQLRRVINLLFFTAIIAVAAAMAKKLNVKFAAAFALSVLFVRPQIIGNSMQFTSCFFIAMPAMLCVNWLAGKPKWDFAFFMLVGMLTMYFDFYTYPIITFAYPLIYLYLLRSKEEGMGLGRILGCFGAWAVAYGMMWVTKLTLSTLFSSENALANGFGAMAGWLDPQRADASTIGIMDMVSKVRYSIFPDGTWMAAAAFAVLLLAVYILLSIRKGDYKLCLAAKNWHLIMPAVLPLIWFCVAAEPTYVHAWFQYRSIAVTYFALLALLSTGFVEKEKA